MTDFARYPSLVDKVVLITGGASGIGAAMVEAFAGNDAKVAFVDIQVEPSQKLVEQIGAAGSRPPLFIQCDLTDIEALRGAIGRVRQELGPVGVLVNNAANDDRHKLADVTPAYWDERMAVNLRHMLFAAKAVVPGMKVQGGGAIINFSSIAWHLGLEGLLLYETAKAGIEGMTRALARELGPDNIRVTAVVPGNVKTPRQSKWYTPDGEAELVAQQCLKSRLLPRHVAALVLFLASDDASMCTGHEYWIDAGWG
jgi:D-xylose 1-dehydrogenase